jgi:hypothetical protein
MQAIFKFRLIKIESISSFCTGFGVEGDIGSPYMCNLFVVHRSARAFAIIIMVSGRIQLSGPSPLAGPARQSLKGGRARADSSQWDRGLLCSTRAATVWGHHTSCMAASTVRKLVRRSAAPSTAPAAQESLGHPRLTIPDTASMNAVSLPAMPPSTNALTWAM